MAAKEKTHARGVAILGGSRIWARLLVALIAFGAICNIAQAGTLATTPVAQNSPPGFDRNSAAIYVRVEAIQARRTHQETAGFQGELASVDAYATRGGAKTVFWSGGEGAKRGAAGFAERTGGRTLEMTAVGRELEAAALPWSQAKPLWEAASRDLATSARGHVDVFMSRAARPDSIWRTIERPALQSNPNVTGIRIHLPVVQ